MKTTTKHLALSTLKRSAAMTANAFGHRLEWGAPHGRPAVPHLGEPRENYSLTGRCKCGASVTVTQRGGKIQGAAVSGPCFDRMARETAKVRKLGLAGLGYRTL